MRDGTGKGAARSVRRENRVPGVIYGGGEAAQPISLDYKTLNHLIYAGHFLTTIFDIDLGDGKVERVEVELGLRDEESERVEIKAGLTPGDTLLTGAARGISPGTPVRVSTPSDTPASKS